MPQPRDWFAKLQAFEIIAGCGQVACAHCGYDILDGLHLDHKNGDGHKHRKSHGKGGKGGGMRTYRWVEQHPKEARSLLQVLCANCHQVKTSVGYLPSEEPMSIKEVQDLAYQKWEPEYDETEAWYERKYGPPRKERI